MVSLSPDEVERFRIELKSSPSALAALDVVEACDGHLEDAIALLSMRELNKEPDRGFSDVITRCQKFLCQEDLREELVGGLLGIVIERLANLAGIPPGVTTVVVLFAYKQGAKRFCESADI